MSVNRQMDKDGMIHIYKEILFCHEKEGNPAICKNVNELRGIMLCKIRQTEGILKKQTHGNTE